MEQDNQITVIEAEKLLSQGAAGRAQFLDVRPAFSPVHQRFEGIAHIPISQLSRRMQDFDDRRRIVLICEKGEESKQAYDLLIECGYSAVVVRGGFSDWLHVFELPRQSPG